MNDQTLPAKKVAKDLDYLANNCTDSEWAHVFDVLKCVVNFGKLEDERDALLVAVDGSKDSHRRTLVKLKTTEAERDEARSYGKRLFAECKGNARGVACAYCGSEFKEGTPASQNESLTAHGKVCVSHPMRALEADRDEWENMFGEVAHAVLEAAGLDDSHGWDDGLRKLRPEHDWDHCACGSSCEVCSGIDICKRCGMTTADPHYRGCTEEKK